MIGAPPERGGVAAALARGVGLGVATFALVAAIGQAAGFALYLVRGTGPYAPYARVGVLYLEAFHRVAASGTARVSLESVASASGRVAVTLGVAFTTVTALALWLLVVAARTCARRAGSDAGRRVAVAGAVAGAYALPVSALSVLARGTVPIASGALAGRVSFGVATGQALVLPFALALGASLAGALLDREALGRVADVVRGGILAFALGLALSFAGLLVLAGVEPSATRAYFSAVSESGPTEAALILTHHALVLPSQSMWVLVPAMGGCDTASVGASSTPFLCYGRAPAGLSPDPTAFLVGSATPVGFEPLPRWYLGFLLVPLASCVAGGRRAATGEDRPGRAAALGASSGLVFAALVAAGSALGSITVSGSIRLLGAGGAVGATFGPELVRGTLLAVAWGVGGGALGGALARYGVGGRTTE